MKNVKLFAVLLSGLLLITTGTQSFAQESFSSQALTSFRTACDSVSTQVESLWSSVPVAKVKSFVQSYLPTKKSELVALAQRNPDATKVVAVVAAGFACYGFYKFMTHKSEKK